MTGAAHISSRRAAPRLPRVHFLVTRKTEPASFLFLIEGLRMAKKLVSSVDLSWMIFERMREGLVAREEFPLQ